MGLISIPTQSIVPSPSKGLKFDGINDYVDSDVYNTSDNVSVYIEFKANSGNVNSLPFLNGSDYRGFGIIVSGDSLLLLVSGIAVPFVSTINLETKYKITLTYLGSVFKVYVNKVLTLIYNLTFNAITNADKFTISQSVYVFKGGVYNTKIFSKELNQTEIDYLNDNDSTIPPTASGNVIREYNFTDSQGTTLIDSSPSALNGTLINYASGTTDFGDTNSWINDNDQPIGGVILGTTKIIPINII